VVTGTDVPNGEPTMVDEYDGGLAAVVVDGVVDELVVDDEVEPVPTVICPRAGMPASNTQPITGHQISCE
jgi:hypothetical protein